MSDLDELERLARAATPGPWEVDGDGRDICGFAGRLGAANGEPPYEITENNGFMRNSMAADAAFIAAANPAVVLELVRRLRAAEGIVRDLADGGDPISPGIAACAVCRAWQPGAEPMKLTDHDEDCAYRRATEYVK